MPQSEAMMRVSADRIVTARLLILQSKRLLLVRALSKVRFRRLPEPNSHVLRLEGEVRNANESYRDSVLKWASVESNQYWLVAYGTLVEGAEELSAALDRAASSLPQPDRGDVLVDAQRLDGIIESWRELTRTTMARAVA
jgi:hypothetical protein